MEEFLEQLKQLNEVITLKEKDKWLLLEGEGLTYYQLRQFLTVLLKQVHDKVTKDVLANILKTLVVMEIKKLPIPTIQKLKSTSPKIFN